MSAAREIDDEIGAHELARLRRSFGERLAWLRRAVWRFGELSAWRLKVEEAEEVERVVLATLRPVVVDGKPR